MKKPCAHYTHNLVWHNSQSPHTCQQRQLRMSPIYIHPKSQFNKDHVFKCICSFPVEYTHVHADFHCTDLSGQDCGGRGLKRVPNTSIDCSLLGGPHLDMQKMKRINETRLPCMGLEGTPPPHLAQVTLHSCGHSRGHPKHKEPGVAV